jgi:hypothetical protein
MNIDINKQNIKAIKYMHEYLEKIFVSFYSLYKIFKNFNDELYILQNELDFHNISEQIIDSYNKLITFLYEQVKSILAMLFISENSKEILIIKPVRDNKYSQDIELTYFTNDIIATKPLGNITSMSINQINDEFIFLRGNRKFTFIILGINSEITNIELREHIEMYIQMIREIINWIYSDIKSIRISIKTLIEIISELSNLSPKKYDELLIKILENIKKTIDKIDKIDEF